MSSDRPRSKKIFQEALAIIPGGVNSPVRAGSHLGITPLVVERGKGAYIEDVDGHLYIDYCCGFGSLIHGHNPDFIRAAVEEQFAKGASFGISTPIEKELAEMVVKAFPSIEMVRFVSSGTEAVMSALRLARAATGKDTIIKFEGHYHGHLDALLVKAGSSVLALCEATSLGVPSSFTEHTVSLPFNDEESFLQALEGRDDIAAVILEPIVANMGVVLPNEGFLKMVREETRKRGILLIFDEVVTGFRLGLQGAQGMYRIEPDLTCLGKIIGGGFPAAAFGGKRKWMEMVAPLGGVYQAGTLSGFPLAMAAGKSAIKALQNGRAYQELEEKGKRLTQPILDYIDQHALPATLSCKGSMLSLFFGIRGCSSYRDVQNLDRELFCQFFRFMLSKGIYIPPAPAEAWFISLAHQNKELDHTANSVIEFLHTLCFSPSSLGS